MFEIETGGALVLLSLLLIAAWFLVSTPKFSKSAEVNLHSKQSGFTLIELMVVVMILGILTSVGNGALGSMKESRRVQDAAEKVRAMMMAARMHAVANGKAEYVCVDLVDDRFWSTLDGSSTYDPVLDLWGVLPDNVENTINVDLLNSDVDGSALMPPETKKTYTFSSSGVSSAVGESAFLIKHASHSDIASKVVVVSTFTGKVRVDECSAPGKNCQ